MGQKWRRRTKEVKVLMYDEDFDELCIICETTGHRPSTQAHLELRKVLILHKLRRKKNAKTDRKDQEGNE